MIYMLYIIMVPLSNYKILITYHHHITPGPQKTVPVPSCSVLPGYDLLQRLQVSRNSQGAVPGLMVRFFGVAEM